MFYNILYYTMRWIRWKSINHQQEKEVIRLHNEVYGVGPVPGSPIGSFGPRKCGC